MINLVNILKHCPKGMKLYSPIFGEVKFLTVFNNEYIDTYTSAGNILRFQKDGRFDSGGECMLFPSKRQKDWEAGYTWDGETLKKKEPQFKPFDKVLVRDAESDKWGCTFYSHFDSKGRYHHITASGMFAMCIPFEGNEHLVGTTKNP